MKIVYLPGGERIVTSSSDKTVRIWDVENGEQEGTTMEHEGWISGLAVTRDGKRILSGGYDKRISVWDVETHELIEEWEDETGGIMCIAVSPDDQLAASGGERGEIVMREIQESGRIRYSIKAGGHEGGIWGIAYLPSSERVVTCSDDGTVMIWDVVSGEQGTSMDHEDVIVFGLAVTKDGQRILSGDLDKRIKVWDVETHELIEEAWGSHKSGIQSIVLLPDDQFAASGDCNCDGTIIIRERLWNRSDPPDTRCRSCAAPAFQIPLPVVIHVLKVGRKTRLLSSHSCQDRLLACLCCALLQRLGEGGRRGQTFNRDWW
ncbi:hypothetical protein PAXINDRAFT_120526 [Paxillus involutus ATCC 200175]|uniref:WD40 repeat-like protein n=1 Tax=Paxillus involutus ATCC 200175 TaxID=664439 RepID=A0A0C9TLE4_PAXIN|nr:hypothetical protein PAXINDRAFT_120526 [Paxillus involutus ATCC 200175]